MAFYWGVEPQILIYAQDLEKKKGYVLKEIETKNSQNCQFSKPLQIANGSGAQVKQWSVGQNRSMTSYPNYV